MFLSAKPITDIGEVCSATPTAVTGAGGITGDRDYYVTFSTSAREETNPCGSSARDRVHGRRHRSRKGACR
jgi:hypothetical protein